MRHPAFWIQSIRQPDRAGLWTASTPVRLARHLIAQSFAFRATLRGYVIFALPGGPERGFGRLLFFTGAGFWAVRSTTRTSGFGDSSIGNSSTARLRHSSCRVDGCNSDEEFDEPAASRATPGSRLSRSMNSPRATTSPKPSRSSSSATVAPAKPICSLDSWWRPAGRSGECDSPPPRH